MAGHFVSNGTFRFGAVYGVQDRERAEVNKIVGLLDSGEGTLQDEECSLIVDCGTEINREVFLRGLSAAEDLSSAIRFVLKVRGMGYGCEIVRPRRFGDCL